MTHDHRGAGSALLGFIAGAATTAAIGGYFLFGPNGARNRKQVERWLIKAEREIRDKVNSTKEMTEEKYRRIVDEVTSKYARYKEVGKEKAASAATELKARWSDMKREIARAYDEAEQELENEEHSRARAVRR